MTVEHIFEVFMACIVYEKLFEENVKRKLNVLEMLTIGIV